jgi:hypothetical protein
MRTSSPFGGQGRCRDAVLESPIASPAWFRGMTLRCWRWVLASGLVVAACLLLILAAAPEGLVAGTSGPDAAGRRAARFPLDVFGALRRSTPGARTRPDGARRGGRAAPPSGEPPPAGHPGQPSTGEEPPASQALCESERRSPPPPRSSRRRTDRSIWLPAGSGGRSACITVTTRSRSGRRCMRGCSG